MEITHKPEEILAAILRRPRYEVIPLEGAEENVVEHVPREIPLTVTCSPSKGIEATLELGGRLARYGYRTTPHLAARLIVDRAHLADILERLRVLGIQQVFVIAGDADEPAGDFEGASGLLRAMAELGHGLEEIGISGYPESHPIISDEATIQAMYDKEPYATYIVSQICFDPGLTERWIRAVRRRGVRLPLYIGVPGPVSKQKLMRVSARIGLGESARFLRRHSNWLGRMFLPGGFKPDRVIDGLLPAITDPDNRIAGLHVYTFNELSSTESWRQKKLGQIRGLTPDG